MSVRSEKIRVRRAGYQRHTCGIRFPKSIHIGHLRKSDSAPQRASGAQDRGCRNLSAICAGICRRVLPAAAVLAVVSMLMPVSGLPLTACAYDRPATVEDTLPDSWKEVNKIYYVATRRDPLYLRSGPDISYDEFDLMPRGSEVLVLRVNGDWGLVKYGTEIGFCKMEWLSEEPPADNPDDHKPENLTQDAEKNRKIIYDYIIHDLGLSTAAACGIIGNISVETGGTYDPETWHPADAESAEGYGICQWNNSEDAGYRVDQLKAYTDQWQTLAGQLDFIRNDLLHNDYLIYLNLYDDMKAIPNTEEGVVAASDRWAAAYEGCAKYTYEARRQESLAYWKTFTPDSVVQTTAEITEKPKDEPKIQQQEGKAYIVATKSDNLNMRSAPFIADNIIGFIPKGSEVTVTGMTDDGKWGKAEWNGKSGYCAMEYLVEKSDSDTAQTGDINGDSSISVEDAQLVLIEYVNTLSGKNSSLTEQQKKAGDVNRDNSVSVEDAQIILIYYVRNTLSGQSVTWEDLRTKL